MKFTSPLSQELRGKYNKRRLRPREGDSVKIVRGGYKGIEGKVTRVSGSEGKVYIEGVTREKLGGGTAPSPIDPSKVIITNMNLDDKLRKRRVEGE